MPDRKPAGVPFESWIDRQIREAEERGEFDDLPGAGKPLPNLHRDHDEMWWIKAKVEREGLTMPLPPTLALRKEAEEALADALGARSETEARRIVEDVNDKIREAIRTGLSGPPLNLMPYDADRIVAEWRERRRGPR
ncbi:DUF1992 domain-containing protein [Nonomuraea jiangxiensis]|uniref:DnaJ homologue subfamily C member 28 conserved domain-containing protein n=1 Tax=Nonomuraea jiangxiensis TaxID=633440 RepID=A0A1G9SZU1_9ACTN|nr:DUF1992 domain-containing protein [Nonomuraea jiangxiensis]SDM40908.1 protein of unknown function [Nonomuraea jiangxiensis]